MSMYQVVQVDNGEVDDGYEGKRWVIRDMAQWHIAPIVTTFMFNDAGRQLAQEVCDDLNAGRRMVAADPMDPCSGYPPGSLGAVVPLVEESS